MTAPTPLTPAIAAEIVRLYASGLSITAVAIRVDVGEYRVRRALQGAGATIRPSTRTRVIPAAEIVRLYQMPGMSIEKVARSASVACITVRQALMDAGVTLRTSGNQPGEDRTPAKYCKDMTWGGLNDKADIPADLFEIKGTYRR